MRKIQERFRSSVYFLVSSTPVLGRLAGVDLGVLGVHVENGIAQHADGFDRIDALPEHVAGIVVAADARPAMERSFSSVSGL